MKKDYIVEEVRKHRREIEEECGNDFRLILARAKETQKKLAEKIKAKPAKPIESIPLAA